VSAGLGQPTIRDQHGAWLEELGQGLGLAQQEGVLQQGLQLLRGARSRVHDGA
jgi:hypothetical protein